MSVFSDYSAYYDIFNTSKEYEKEVDFLIEQVAKTGANEPSLLDLGCGTGMHASALAGRGWRVTGVDMSNTMLDVANSRRESAPKVVAERLDFQQGDVRTVRLGRQFDVVASLFHVASYQTAPGDLARLLETAKVHLKPDGILIFDYWYGPAVLNLKPSTRVRRYEDDTIKAMRVGEPTMHVERNVVNVDFEVTLIEKSTGLAKSFTETHAMRYFFATEIDALLRDLDFTSWRSSEWMSASPSSETSWSVFTVASL